MFIIKNQNGDKSEPFSGLRFWWLNGDQGYDAVAGMSRGSERIYSFVENSFDVRYYSKTGYSDSFNDESNICTRTPITANKSLAETKAARKEDLRNSFDVRGQSLVSDYAPTERETWAEQSKAAEAYQANPGGSHPYLEAMVKEGETVADLAALILANAAALKSASASLIKIRREYEAAIDAATDVADVLAVNVNSGWPF